MKLSNYITLSALGFGAFIIASPLIQNRGTIKTELESTAPVARDNKSAKKAEVEEKKRFELNDYYANVYPPKVKPKKPSKTKATRDDSSAADAKNEEKKRFELNDYYANVYPPSVKAKSQAEKDAT